jgi:hypothetical protein
MLELLVRTRLGALVLYVRIVLGRRPAAALAPAARPAADGATRSPAPALPRSTLTWRAIAQVRRAGDRWRLF